MPADQNDDTLRKWLWLAYLVIGGLIIGNSYYIAREEFVFLALPVMALFAFLVFFKPVWGVVAIGFFTPLSIRYEVAPLQSTFNFPTEPMIAMIMMLFLFKVALDWRYDSNILKHPIAIAIMLNMAWILIAAVFSTMPFVSWKFFFSRLWFVLVFYFVAVEIFKNPERIKQFLFGFSISLALVVIYATYYHSGFNFQQHIAYYVVRPFMNDHTEYGAVLALFLPIAGAFAWKGKVLGLNNYQRIISLVFFLVFLTGIFFSFSRASWLGVIGATGMLVCLYLRIRLWLLVLIIGAVITVIYQNQHEIIYWLEQNKEVSDTGLEEHIHSIYNITTDASNIERLNRWVSAKRMYEEKPLLGWGPGTYMFQYAQFQLAQNMTVISTRVGDQGNAHSEYLGPLAETGLPGMLTYILILGLVIHKGMYLYYNGKTEYIRVLAACVLLSITTYVVHGFLNNFLDFDKVSVPFWSLIAIMTVLDLKNKGKDEEIR